MGKSDIPFGDSFSPGRGVRLGELLQIVADHETRPDQLLPAIYKRFWSKKADGTRRPAGLGKGKEAASGDGLSLAANTFYSLRAYGLITGDPGGASILTETGKRLLAMKDEDERVLEFAKHILLNCRGLDVLETVKDMQMGKHRVTVPDIAKHLQERGVQVPEAGTHLNTMGQWLRKAGVLGRGWETQQSKLDQILGVDEPTLDALAELEPTQVAFARGLARLNVDEISSEKVRDYARDIYGVDFPVKSLPKSVLQPLANAGLVTYEKTTKGRGAKPHIVRPTKLLREQVAEPILERLDKALGGRKYRKLIRMGLDQILAELDLPVEETHRRGLALEALAIYLTRIIGLEFRGWRSTPAARSYEVDAIVEGIRFVFSRWQIQCKNTTVVNEGDVAKEVGLAVAIKSNVLMVVSTGRFSASARDYSSIVMESTNYNVILLDSGDLKELASDPSRIGAMLQREAKRAMEIKRTTLPENL